MSLNQNGNSNLSDPPNRIIEALEDVASRYAELAKNLQADLNEVQSKKDIIELAESFTVEMLAYLPLSQFYCPFCSLHNPECQSCQDCHYGAKYGICTQKDSLYSQVVDAHYHLVDAVQNIDLEKFSSKEYSPTFLEELKTDIFKHADQLIDRSSKFQHQVATIESPERMMTLKREFMIDLVRGLLPLDRACNHCGVEFHELFEAKEKALEGLSLYWINDYAATA